LTVTLTLEPVPVELTATLIASRTRSWPVPSASKVPVIGLVVSPTFCSSGLSDVVRLLTAAVTPSCVTAACPAAICEARAAGLPVGERATSTRLVSGVTFTVPSALVATGANSTVSSRVAETTRGASALAGTT
jgi:hypothetical protein